MRIIRRFFLNIYRPVADGNSVFHSRCHTGKKKTKHFNIAVVTPEHLSVWFIKLEVTVCDITKQIATEVGTALSISIVTQTRTFALWMSKRLVQARGATAVWGRLKNDCDIRMPRLMPAPPTHTPFSKTALRMLSQISPTPPAGRQARHAWRAASGWLASLGTGRSAQPAPERGGAAHAQAAAAHTPHRPAHTPRTQTPHTPRIPRTDPAHTHPAHTHPARLRHSPASQPQPRSLRCTGTACGLSAAQGDTGKGWHRPTASASERSRRWPHQESPDWDGQPVWHSERAECRAGARATLWGMPACQSGKVGCLFLRGECSLPFFESQSVKETCQSDHPRVSLAVHSQLQRLCWNPSPFTQSPSNPKSPVHSPHAQSEQDSSPALPQASHSRV